MERKTVRFVGAAFVAVAIVASGAAVAVRCARSAPATAVAAGLVTVHDGTVLDLWAAVVL